MGVFSPWLKSVWITSLVLAVYWGTLGDILPHMLFVCIPGFANKFSYCLINFLIFF